jgi:short-chain fatty acids transporter
VAEGTAGCAGIILQFPLYAGIMGVMKLSGLGKALALSLSEHVGASWHGVVTFLSAGALNFFIPSGGGQWGVQSEIVITSARELGLPLGPAIMAFCYGDCWTNLLQVFWALPLLAVTHLRVQEIIGYTALLMFLVTPIYIACLSFFG